MEVRHTIDRVKSKTKNVENLEGEFGGIPLLWDSVSEVRKDPAPTREYSVGPGA